jgi:hypothetical protein
MGEQKTILAQNRDLDFLAEAPEAPASQFVLHGQPNFSRMTE